MAEEIEKERNTEKKEKGATEQVNMRLPVDDVNGFKKLCEELGVTQGYGFTLMYNAYVMSRTAEQLPERKAEMDATQSYMAELMKSYSRSWDFSANLSTIIRSEVSTEIEGLQKRLRNLHQQNEQFSAAAKESKALADSAVAAREAAIEARANAEGTAALEKARADAAEEMVAYYKEKNDDLITKAEAYDNLRREYEELQTENQNLKSDLNDSRTDKKILESEKDRQAAEIAKLESENADQKEQNQTQQDRISQLQEQKSQLEADNKILESEKQHSAAEVERLKAENAELKERNKTQQEQNDRLQSQINQLYDKLINPIDEQADK